MVQDTQREPKSRRNKKLTEAQRAGVARQLRTITDDWKTIRSAFKLVEEALEKEALTTNEEMAMLEEALDTLREGCRGIKSGEETFAHKKFKEKAEALLLDQLDDDNLPSFKVKGAGTVSSSRRKFWKMADPEKIFAYVKKTGDFELFTTAISEAWCNAYLEKHGKKPPGADFWEKHSISFTAERQKVTKKKP